MLHVVTNDTKGVVYCGPTAVASITGKPMSKVLENFRRVRYGDLRTKEARTARIKGTGPVDVMRCLKLFGYQMQAIAVAKKDVSDKPEVIGSGWLCYSRKVLALPTLAEWMRSRRDDDLKTTFIVNVSNHWVAVSGRKFCDTFTKGVPVFIREAPHRRKRVRAVYRVVKI